MTTVETHHPYQYSIPCRLLDSRATLPTRRSEGAAGYDIHALLPRDQESLTIAPMARAMIPTGLSMSIFYGYYGRIAPRSGLAVRYGIDVLGGVIDSDYTGEIKVILINLGSEPFVVRTGDRIAQLIIESCADKRFIAVDTLPFTSRGDSGFGSTGI